MTVTRYRQLLDARRWDEAAAEVRADLISLIDRDGPNSQDVADAAGALLHAVTLAADDDWAHGRHADACARYREASKELGAALGDTHPSVADALNSQGLCESQAGALPEAGITLNRALAAIRARVGEHDNGILAAVLDNLGVVRQETGQLVEAERLHLQALGICQRLGNESDCATCVHNVGDVYLKMGRLCEGVSALESALETRRRLLDPHNPELALTMHSLAQALSLEGRDDEALSLAGDALAIYDAASVPYSDPSRLRMEHTYAVLLGVAGNDAQQALERLAEVLERERATLGPKHRYTAYAAWGLADTLLGLGRPDDAAPLVQDALDGFAASLGRESVEYGQTLKLLATLQLKQDQPDDALASLLSATAIDEACVRELAATGSERQRLELLAAGYAAMSGFVALVRDHYRSEPRALRRALELVLRTKGLSAEVLAVERAASGDDPRLCAVLDGSPRVRASRPRSLSSLAPSSRAGWATSLTCSRCARARRGSRSLRARSYAYCPVQRRSSGSRP